MPISLYDITVPVYIRALKNLSAILKKTETWCDENSKPHSAILEAQLAPDMKDLAFQARFTTCMARSGVLSTNGWRWVPHHETLPDERSFAGLQAGIQKAIEDIEKVKKEDVEGNEDTAYDFWTEGVEGQGMHFEFSTGLKYLNQIVWPNFWFHLTTAYDICRAQGAPIGKFDFLAGGGGFE